MQNFTLQSTVGHRLQDHLERQALFNAEPFGPRTCNTLEPPGTNVNRVSRIRENRNGRQVPGTNFDSGSTEYRQSPRHGLSYTPITSRNASKNQSRSKMSQDHLIPLVERSYSQSSNFGSMNGDMIVNSWVTDPDPLTAYNLHCQAHQPFTPNHVQQRYHGSAQELAGVGEAVGDYLVRTRNASLPSLYLSTPEEFCGDSGSNLDRRISTTSSSFDEIFGISSPSTPKSETLTMGSTLPSDMSRQSSCIEGLGMMRINSSVSDFSSPAGFGPHGDTSITNSRSSNEEQSLWLAGAGGAGHFLSNQSSDIFSETVGPLEVTEFTIEDMQRSQSINSNVSGSSTSSRSKQQLQRQIQLAAARPIAPKQEDELLISRQGSASSMASANHPNSIQDRAVTAITKIPYQRPKHERVHCKKCEEYPDGFRGEHELRRHQDRQHKLVVKKWICIESPTRSQADSPIIPLSKCKACQQKKKYGAYYNAAAHLRRSHFRPKPKSRVKGGRVEDKLQKRGGKGGGDWPPMTQLKNWMEEVAEMVTDNQTADVDDNDDDDAEVESLFPIDNLPINFHSTPNFNNVLMQHKPNFAFKDLGSMQFDLRQDASISSLHKSASVQPNFGIQHIPLNMQQQNFITVKRHDTTSTYGSRVFMDVSPYIDTSYNEDFNDLQDLEFDHLSNNFM